MTWINLMRDRKRITRVINKSKAGIVTMAEEEQLQHASKRQTRTPIFPHRAIPNPTPIPSPIPSPVRSSTDVEGARKRVWGVTDPFSFAPCEFHAHLLQTVEPLLLVRAPGDLPQYDKFAGGMMDKETLMQAVRVLLKQYPSTSRLFSTAKTELNIRPRHIALLSNLHMLTRPSKHDLASLHLHMHSGSLPAVLSAQEADDVSGLQIKGGGEKMNESEIASSNEGLDLDHEAAPEGEDLQRGKGRADFKAYVWDKAPLKIELSDFIKKSLRLKRLVLVAESKCDEDIDALAQAAGYARPTILRNHQNWHIQPTYLITLAASQWTYGILDVYGSLTVQNNMFSNEDFEAYKKQEKVRRANGDHVELTSEELKERLSVGLRRFREKFRAKPGASFPPKKYLVGEYYESELWFPLPVIGSKDGLCTAGSLRFYEGLLRVIIGERVLKWKPSDVQNVYDTQLDLQEELDEIEGLGPTREELDRAKDRLEKKRQKLGVVEDVK